MLLKLGSKLWKKLPKSGRRWLTRRAQTNFTVSAAGVVTNESGQVLLLNHLLRPVSGWGLPGGFINSGEQPEEGFRRELREETGIDLCDVKLAHIRTLHRHIEVIFVARGIGEAKVQSREITELGWFDLDSMPDGLSLDQRFLILKILRPEKAEINIPNSHFF